MTVIFMDGPEVWCRCDKCSFTEFAGFDAKREDVFSLKRWGWTFGKRQLCPECSKGGK